MRINEITNSTEKLELLRMIDAAIWQAFDAESAYGDYDDSKNIGKGVATTTPTNQITPKPVATKSTQTPTQKPVKKLTQQQLSHVKTLGPQQLLQYIKTNLKAPTAAASKPATSIRPNSNPAPVTNNSQVPNTSFDTVNAKNDVDNNKADDKD
jgi:hypothetical protein